MRLLHIIDRFAPATGGPPEALRQLIRASRAAGTDVEAVCLDDPQADYLKGIDCPVHALGQSYLGRFAYSARLGRWLKENGSRYDALVMHGIWSFPGLATRAAAQQVGRPYGIFPHGALDPWFNRKYPIKHLKKRLYWPLQYRVLRDAAAVFFTTETERELASTSFSPSQWRGVVVPYGISEPETPAGGEEAQREAFYGRFPELRSKRFFLFLGRIQEKKGCDLLIEGFARIAGEEPEVDLVLAGPDQEGTRAKLEKLAEARGIPRRVHWTGMIQDDVKWGALRACEAFVLTSHQENLGISVVEALAVGRPVLVSTQVNLWPEIREDGVGLAEEDTREGAERLLRRWFELTAEERTAMAERARPCYAARFSMKAAEEAIRSALDPVQWTPQSRLKA